MATLESQDANILDADPVNWRLVVYPIVGLLILVLGGLGIYYYTLGQRQLREDQARTAFLQAKTPEALIQVADQFPKTTHAVFALLSAADLSFAKKDFDAADKDYQRVLDGPDNDAVLRDSAQVGLASSLEAGNKTDNALNAYLTVARRGNGSPYAPYAYSSAARIYDQKNDKENERKILTEAAGLNGESPYVKQAQMKLRALNATATSPGTNAALVPAKP